jgi:hypothetical protein
MANNDSVMGGKYIWTTKEDSVLWTPKSIPIKNYFEFLSYF